MTKLLVDLPTMEKEYGLIAKMYAVADEFDVPLPPEELALYRTLLPSFTHLKVSYTGLCCLLLLISRLVIQDSAAFFYSSQG